MDYRMLDEKILNNQIEDAVVLVQLAGERKDKKAVPFLIKHLKATEDNQLRNCIAIALSDIGATEAVKPLLLLLNDPKTINNRGTLLYALEAFDISDSFENIVDLLFEDNFEVSRHSLILIESMAQNVSNEIKDRCLLKINKKVEFYTDKVDFLTEAIEIIEN